MIGENSWILRNFGGGEAYGLPRDSNMMRGLRVLI